MKRKITVEMEIETSLPLEEQNKIVQRWSTIAFLKNKVIEIRNEPIANDDLVKDRKSISAGDN